MHTISYLLRLFGLAIRFRRYGALRALASIEMVPSNLVWLLRLLTFYIPHKFGLPKEPGERLAAAFAAMGPSYIKLGQTLATRPDVVGADVARGLTTLQDRLPAFDFVLAKAAIEDELDGKLEDFFSHIDETPIAAASIAQVHKATTCDGEIVAVKVLRPGIKRRFAADMALFTWIAEKAERHSNKAKRLRPMAVVKTLSDSVAREMDLRLEAAAASELAENMQDFKGYRIPAIYWSHTSERILTSEWISGIKLTDIKAVESAGHDMSALARIIVQAFLTQAMYHGFFHADLHQGNLLVEEDGTLVAVDFGIMGRLSIKERRFLAEILHSFIIRDYNRVAEVHFDAGYVPRDQSLADFAQALRAIAEPILDLPIEEMLAGTLLTQLFATTERFAMQTQPQLIMLQRSMVMAEGLALHLDPTANMFEVSRPVLEGWARENLSPEVLLADALRKIPSLLTRLPEALERFVEKKSEVSTPAREKRTFWQTVLPGLGLAFIIIVAFASFVLLLP